MSKTNTQLAKYGVNPFQRVEINISNVNRSTPEFFAQLEGEELIVERCDYPVILSLVNPSTSVEQAYVLRDGMRIRASFKGIYIAHPLLPQFADRQPARLSLIVSKNDAATDNSYANPVSRFPAMYNVSSNAVSCNIRLYVPPGCRQIKKLKVFFGTYTTITVLPSWQFLAPELSDNVERRYSTVLGNVVHPVSKVTYVNGAFCEGYMEIEPTIIANTLIAKDDDIVIPIAATALEILLTGTGLNMPFPTVNAVFE